MTTRQDIEYLVTKWKLRLRLTHWQVKVDWEKPAVKGAFAEMGAQDDYDVATLLLEPGYANWEPRLAEEVVVHELMHLVMRDLQVHVQALHPLLETQTRKLARTTFTHELEGVVDRVATVLVALARAE